MYLYMYTRMGCTCGHLQQLGLRARARARARAKGQPSFSYPSPPTTTGSCPSLDCSGRTG